MNAKQKRDAKNTKPEPSAFETRENMLDEEETMARAADRVGNVPQVARADQKGNVGSELGDEWIESQKESVEHTGGEG